MMRAGILVLVLASTVYSSPLAVAVDKVEVVAPVAAVKEPVVAEPIAAEPAAAETVIVEPVIAPAPVPVERVAKPEARSIQDDTFNDVARVGRVPVTETTTGEEQLIRKLNTRCSQKDTSSCVLLKMVTYFNRLIKKSSISLGDTVEIERTSAVSVAAVDSEARTLSGDTDEEKLTNLVTDKLYNFARSRALRIKFIPGADLLVSPVSAQDGSVSLSFSMDSGDSAEGRGKKNNILPAIAAAAAMKIGMIGVIAFKVLVLLVGKALILSKIAFLIAALIGIKKLTSQTRHVTYEVVAQPQHGHHESHGHDSYSSGWGRSLDTIAAEAHDLAYRGQKPTL